MRKHFIVYLVVFLICLFAAGAVMADDHITSKCGVYVKVARVEQFVGYIAEYANFIGWRMNSRKILNQFSVKLTGRPGFPGIDLRKAVQVYFYKFSNSFLTSGKSSKSSFGKDVVMVIPVSSRSLFKRSFSMMLGLMRVSQTFRRGVVILATSRRALLEYRRGKRIKAVIIRNSQLSLYANYDLFRKEFVNKLNGLFAKGHKLRSSFAGSFFNMYLGIFLFIFSMGYSLNLDRSGLEVGFAMGFKRRSKLASVFVSSGSKRLKSLDIIPGDSIVVYAGKIPMDKWSRYLGGMISPLKKANRQLGNLFAALIDYTGRNSSGESAMAMLPRRGEGLSFAVVNGVRSRFRAREFYYRLKKMVNKLELIKQLKSKGVVFHVEYLKNAESLSGKDVDIFRIRVASTAPLTALQVKIVNLVRKLFTIRITYSKGFELMALGEGSSRRLQEMIRNSRGSGEGFRSSVAYRKFRRKYGRYASNGMFYFSCDGFFQEIKDFMISAHLWARRQFRQIRIPGNIYGYSYSNRTGFKMRVLIDRDMIMGSLNLRRMFTGMRSGKGKNIQKR